MEEKSLIPAIEAILFAGGNPIEAKRIASALGITEDDAVRLTEQAALKLSGPESGIKIIKLNDKYQMCSKSEYGKYINDIINLNRNTSLSSAAMEVLAVTAYNQPVTKSFVENVRGVDCSRIINSLVQKELIEECGRLEVPGKTVIYKVTDNFLRCFGVSSTEELPRTSENEENRGEK